MGKNSNRGVMFLFTLLLFGSLIFWPTSTASAEELYVEELEIFTEDLELDTSDLPDNEELFAGYVDKMFYGTEISTFGSAGRERLTDVQKLVYDYLKEELEKIADGRRTTSIITIEESTLNAWVEKGFQKVFTASELELETVLNDAGNALSDAAKLAYKTKAYTNQINFNTIYYALSYDCPFELYWFDKSGASVNGYYYMSGKGDGSSMWMTSLVYEFGIVSAYQKEDLADGEEAIYTPDVTKTSATSTAVANAMVIVEENASKGDYNKLKAYCDTICELTKYNDAAAEDGYTDLYGYGDPWQLIYVFDGDTSTDVVCEGYAKAFQYLCDMSEFESDKIRSYIVSGVTSGGHMWNIVTMDDGNNYFVDVTNVDAEEDQISLELFLAGGTGSIATGYTIDAYNGLYDIT